MRIGVRGQNRPPFDRAVDSAVAAEKNGDIDWMLYWDQLTSTHPRSIWTPDITSAATASPYLDAHLEPAVAIAAAAQHTDRLEYVYGVIDVVRRPPALIAQTLLTLDHATRGKVTAIIAIGENKQMKQYGISRKGAVDKLHDSLKIVQKFLETTDAISFRGRVWNLDRASVGLPRYGARKPPVWVAGGGPDTLELIGKYADGWLTYLPGAADDSPEVFAEQVREVRRHAERAGRDPHSIAIATTLLTIIHPDENLLDELRDHPIVRWNAMLATPTARVHQNWGIEHPYGDDWTFSRDCIPPWISREEALDVASRTPREAVDKTHLVGTADQVLDKFRSYAHAGVTDVQVINYVAMATAEHAAEAQRATDQFHAAVKNL